MAGTIEAETDELEQFIADLIETLNGDWRIISTEENTVTGLPIVTIGFTPAENGLGDHARLHIEENEGDTYTVRGFTGTLAQDGQFSTEYALAHIEFEDTPEGDLRALDSVRDFVQMVCEGVENGNYFDVHNA